MGTTTPLGPEFDKELISFFFSAFDQGQKEAAQILWSVLIVFLKADWPLVLIMLFLAFLFVTIKAGLGRWGSLGSLLYNTLYFGILLIAGLIWGPDIFVSDYFHASCTVLLYPTCYWTVGLILDAMGVTGRRF